MTNKHKVSNCCGASPRHDIEEEGGICSECREYCEYVEEIPDEK
jgi:hypothetical protein